jgi:septum formation protein
MKREESGVRQLRGAAGKDIEVGGALRHAPYEARFYLASRSPRRRELLEQAGFVYAELPAGAADVDETPRSGEAAVDYVVRVASEKAVAGWRAIATHGLAALPVLTADTTVVLEGAILGKPDNARHAGEMLSLLSGRVHQVFTAIALADAAGVTTRLSTSAVEFRDLSPAEIESYVATGEPLDKAGAYAVQGRAAVFIRTISGSYSGIMGLPLFETAELLDTLGIGPR